MRAERIGKVYGERFTTCYQFGPIVPILTLQVKITQGKLCRQFALPRSNRPRFCWSLP